jgi:AraC-like DNA-binding protein
MSSVGGVICGSGRLVAAMRMDCGGVMPGDEGPYINSNPVAFESERMREVRRPKTSRYDAVRYVRYEADDIDDVRRHKESDGYRIDFGNLDVLEMGDHIPLSLHLLARQDVRFMHVRAPAMQLAWSRVRPSQQMAMLFLRMGGDYEILTPGAHFVRDPGISLVMPGSEPLRYGLTDRMNELILLSFDPRMFADVLPGHPEPSSVSSPLPALDDRVLDPLLGLLSGSCVAANEHPAAARDVGEALYALASSVLLTTFGQLAFADRSLYALAVEYAAQHQADPDLNVAQAARFLEVSPRTIQQAFQERGTCFSHHLRRLRTETAMRMRASRPDLSLGEVARRCGFGSLSSLSRALRNGRA